MEAILQVTLVDSIARLSLKFSLTLQVSLAIIESMMTTPILKAVNIVGGQSALARLLGVTPQAVQQWCDKNRVPAERVIPIVMATAGQVSCHELRPDLYPDEEPGAKMVLHH